MVTQCAKQMQSKRMRCTGRPHGPEGQHREFSGKCASNSQVKAILNINDFLLHGLTTFIFSKTSN